jgi:hypothetical protein
VCRGSWNLLPATGVVEPAVEIPYWRFGGGRARCDQFSGQPWGFIAQNVVPWIRDATGSTIAPMLFLAACLAAGGLMTFFVQAAIRRRHPEVAVAA